MLVDEAALGDSDLAVVGCDFEVWCRTFAAEPRGAASGRKTEFVASIARLADKSASSHLHHQLPPARLHIFTQRGNRRRVFARGQRPL